MAPHCDSMDGPVVAAAREALERRNVKLVLPFVQEDGEQEVMRAFEAVERARGYGSEAREVADLYFFETVVRIHRAGEGAPYTGLKPAGTAEGPVIPVAEMGIESGDPGAPQVGADQARPGRGSTSLRSRHGAQADRGDRRRAWTRVRGGDARPGGLGQ